MAWECFLAPTGVGGACTETQQRHLDQFLRALPTFVGWNAEAQEYQFVDTDWATMRFTPEGLAIWWDDYTPEWKKDLFSLVQYGRSLGMGLFKDTGEEFMWDFVVWMFGPRG